MKHQFENNLLDKKRSTLVENSDVFEATFSADQLSIRKVWLTEWINK